MEGKIVGSVIRQLKRSADLTATSADVIADNIVHVPFGEARHRIAQISSACEVLRRSIDKMQRGLKTLEDLIAGIDDRDTREDLQHRMKLIHPSLSLQLARLSGMDHMPQVTFSHFVAPPGPRNPPIRALPAMAADVHVGAISGRSDIARPLRRSGLNGGQIAGRKRGSKTSFGLLEPLRCMQTGQQRKRQWTWV
jgi:hypothetical protein